MPLLDAEVNGCPVGAEEEEEEDEAHCNGEDRILDPLVRPHDRDSDSPGTPLCTRAGRIPPPNKSSSIGPSQSRTGSHYLTGGTMSEEATGQKRMS